jgi:hypothetical protein
VGHEVREGDQHDAAELEDRADAEQDALDGAHTHSVARDRPPALHRAPPIAAVVGQIIPA